MAFFTSIFRNLKNGGAVYEKPSRYHQWLIDNPGGIRKKEGGEVKSGLFYNLSKNPKFMELLEKANKPQPTPIAKKKGGRIAKKSKTKKQKK